MRSFRKADCYRRTECPGSPATLLRESNSPDKFSVSKNSPYSAFFASIYRSVTVFKPEVNRVKSGFFCIERKRNEITLLCTPFFYIFSVIRNDLFQIIRNCRLYRLKRIFLRNKTAAHISILRLKQNCICRRLNAHKRSRKNRYRI